MTFYSSNTFRLFKRKPSFLGGFGSIIDLSGPISKYNYTTHNATADYEAIKSDWEQVGNDMRHAIKEYERSHT